VCYLRIEKIIAVRNAKNRLRAERRNRQKEERPQRPDSAMRRP
jgi:hypothetical protein